MINKANVPYRNEIKLPLSSIDLAMDKIYSDAGFNGSIIKPRIRLKANKLYNYTGEDYEEYEEESTKLPDKKSYYVAESESEEFQETQISINLRQMADKYVADSGGDINLVEFATFVWNEAICAGKTVMTDTMMRWSVAKRDLATKYVNKRMNSYLMNVQTKTK